MTPEELVLTVDARNRADMHAAGIDSDEILRLMNLAAIRGFGIGADYAASDMRARLTVMKAKLPGVKS